MKLFHEWYYDESANTLYCKDNGIKIEVDANLLTFIKAVKNRLQPYYETEVCTYQRLSDLLEKSFNWSGRQAVFYGKKELADMFGDYCELSDRHIFNKAMQTVFDKHGVPKCHIKGVTGYLLPKCLLTV